MFHFPAPPSPSYSALKFVSSTRDKSPEHLDGWISETDLLKLIPGGESSRAWLKKLCKVGLLNPSTPFGKKLRFYEREKAEKAIVNALKSGLARKL